MSVGSPRCRRTPAITAGSSIRGSTTRSAEPALPCPCRAGGGAQRAAGRPTGRPVGATRHAHMPGPYPARHASAREAVVPNGLAICKLHHAAFDANILGIRPDYTVDLRLDVLVSLAAEERGPLQRERTHSDGVQQPRSWSGRLGGLEGPRSRACASGCATLHLAGMKRASKSSYFWIGCFTSLAD